MNQDKMSTKSILMWMGAVLAITIVIIAVVKLADSGPVDPNGGNSVSDDLPPVTAEDWKMGSTTGITLIEYSDFQCPACGYYFPTVERIVSEYKDKMQFVYRHFPLPQHQQARGAAYAAEAAGKQGKFWEMYRMLFQNQTAWSGKGDAEKTFETYAERIGLNVAQFRTDVKDSALRNSVQDDYQGGVGASINSTPTFFLNGKKLKNPSSYEEFKFLIDAELATSS